MGIGNINNLRANGGTEMLSGIRTAINFPSPAERLRSVVLLTDGYIGNENEILVFEFTVNKDRVAGIMLDEEASTQKDADVVEKIKRSLLVWRVPPSTTGKLVLILRIHT